LPVVAVRPVIEAPSQSENLGDPETGCSNAVKRFWSKKEYGEDG
jgi:hypothetical protein